MLHTRHLAVLVGVLVTLKELPRQDRRGLSQSAETAILIGAAVTVAVAVMTFIISYVNGKIGEING